MPLREPKVKKQVIKWLSGDYQIMHISEDKGRTGQFMERGRPLKAPSIPDILAKKRDQNSYYYIEAKGGNPNVNTLYNVLGEIVTRRAAKTPAKYAIALPKSFSEVIHRYLSYRSWKKLGIYVLLVDEISGQVQEFPPTKQSYETIRRLK